MNDGKIYIYISNNPPKDDKSGATIATGGSGGNGGTTKKKEMLNHWAKSHLISIGKQIVTTSANYALSNIGNFTGDYITQTHVTHTMNFAGNLASVGMGAIAGFQFGGGPIGAVIGASLAIVNQGISGVTSMISAYNENSKINYEISQLKERSGLNVSIDGSRGTYD